MAYVKRGATVQDCMELSTRLRAEDVKEVMASRPNQSIAVSLIECLNVSHKSFSVIEEGVGCIAVFGIRECHLGGIPWLLTSDELIEKSPRAFLRQSRDYFREFTEPYDLTFNHVSSTNKEAHRWLQWLGFTLDTTRGTTINGVTFHPFFYRKESNVRSG
jgi:hypothetical protein